MQYADVSNYLKPKHGLINLTSKRVIENIVNINSIPDYSKEEMQTAMYYFYKFNGILVDRLLLDHNVDLNFLQY